MIFQWKQLYVPIELSGLDLMMNDGSHQISDLVQDEMDEAELRAADIVGEQIFGTGEGNFGKDLTGLRARSEEHTSELQSHRDLHSFPTRRSSDLDEMDEAELRAADIVGEQIFGTGEGNFGKDLTGLRA